MSVERLKKIEIVALKGIKGELLEVLQAEGSVHILSINNTSPDHSHQTEHENVPTIRDNAGLLGQIEYTLGYLKRFEEQKKGMLDSLKKWPIKTSAHEVQALIKDFDPDGYIKVCQGVEKRLNALENEKSELNKRVEDLRPWRAIDVPLKDITDGTTHVEFYPIIIPVEAFDPLKRSLSALSAFVALDQVENLGSEVSFIISGLKAKRAAIEEVLTKHGIQLLSLSAVSETPREWIKKTEERLKEIEKEIYDLRNEGKELLGHLNKLRILYDYYLNDEAKSEIQKQFGSTQKSILIKGWIRQRDIDALNKAINGFDNFLDVAFFDPGKDDVPPVALTNNRLASPFELVTKLYDLPHYSELDPTPILAPFFFLFFGLCMTDLGYGLILALFSYWGLKKLYLTGGTKKLFQLFFLCGISTFFCGLLAGSWFGDIVNYFPKSMVFLVNMKNTLAILDPIKDPIKFLILSLVLGYIQVITGILVRTYKDLKVKDFYTIILLRFPWIIFLTSLILLVLVKGQMLSGTFKWLSIISASVICLSEGRGERNILKRIGTGLLALYGTIGYYADMLSYCRLLALGLATSVIANVVNQMAILSKGIPVIGIVIMFALFIGGHIFNLLINLLGAFVHTSRLQFVEFFTKFFEGGGKVFKPFERQNKFTYVE